MIAKKLPCFEFSWHLAISSLFFSKRKGAETSRCHWLWTFRFSLCGRFMPWIRSHQSKLRSSKDSRAFNISAALESEQVLLFQQPLVEFPITYILRRTVPIFCECRLPNDNLFLGFLVFSKQTLRSKRFEKCPISTSHLAALYR